MSNGSDSQLMNWIYIDEGTKNYRNEISEKLKGRIDEVLLDPSSLNHLPKKERKSMKVFIAEKVSNMIYSAGREVAK